MLSFECVATVVRACVPKMILDDVFEQKDDIAKAVSEELEKVIFFSLGFNYDQLYYVAKLMRIARDIPHIYGRCRFYHSACHCWIC